jgi:hypothetical protein
MRLLHVKPTKTSARKREWRLRQHRCFNESEIAASVIVRHHIHQKRMKRMARALSEGSRSLRSRTQFFSLWLCLQHSFNRRAHLRAAMQHKKGCYHAKVDHLNRCNRHRRCSGIRVVADCARLRASKSRFVDHRRYRAGASGQLHVADRYDDELQRPACRGTVGRDLSAPFDSDLPSDHRKGTAVSRQRRAADQA